MDNKEISLQITLDAIQCGKITMRNISPNDADKDIESGNAFNSKQISDFYTNVYNNLLETLK